MLILKMTYKLTTLCAALLHTLSQAYALEFSITDTDGDGIISAEERVCAREAVH